MIGCAATGTGKTAAFLLPIIERLSGKRGTRALVLAPTRELAIQIADHVEMFGAARKFRGAVVIGGAAMNPQIRELRNQPDIVVATPGRLVDHIEHGTVRLDGIEILVLDEADRMLDMGFARQLNFILARLPKNRQTMLFSATMGGEVAGFAKKALHEPARVEVTRSGTVARGAEQFAYRVIEADKTPLLLALLAQNQDTTLVFTRTQHRAERVAKNLARCGHKVSLIHGGRSQSQRQHALDGFKSGTFRVLVATDIAARGIDVADIGHVVNYDVSLVAEDHVHRIGRTARADAVGKASTLVSPAELPLLHDIERFTRTPITKAELPADLIEWRRELDRFAFAAQSAHGGSGGGGGFGSNGRSGGGGPRGRFGGSRPSRFGGGGGGGSSRRRSSGRSRGARS